MPRKSYDPTFKALVELGPEDWTGLTCGRRAPTTIIDADIATVSGAADKVLRVADTPPYLLHLDFQAGHDSAGLPALLLQRNILLHVRHGLPVRTVAVPLRPDADSPALTGRLEVRLAQEKPHLVFLYQVLRVFDLPPKVFLEGGLGLLPLASGSFMMGSPKEEKDRGADETQHKVTLTKGVYMGVYTVTQEQWKELMGNNPSSFKGEKNLPVENVSWDECQEFIKKLREKDKKPYRLPTEAEWEYACRAGTTTPFHFGETISTDQANYDGNFIYGNGKKGVNRNKTMPVGSFPANVWGLHDMHGNVWQWAQDWDGEYPQKDVVDPQGAENGGSRVLRGGSCIHHPANCRSAFRDRHEPGYRHGTLGLRVCFFPD